jgi:hypothetical protein
LTKRSADLTGDDQALHLSGLRSVGGPKLALLSHLPHLDGADSIINHDVCLKEFELRFGHRDTGWTLAMTQEQDKGLSKIERVTGGWEAGSRDGPRVCWVIWQIRKPKIEINSCETGQVGQLGFA